MSKEASDFGTAVEHGPTVLKARGVLIEELCERFSRESVSTITEFVDYMISRRYLTTKCLHAYAVGIEEHADV